MRLRDSTKPNNQGDDLYHLLSISLVVVVSLIAWGVQEFRNSQIPRYSIGEFLCLLDGIEVLSESPPIRNLKPISNSRVSQKAPKKLICLNSVDSTGLDSLPVFGPVLSSRTIKFRDALGGFYCVDQLKEVYGLDSLGFEKVKSFFKIDSSQIHQICLNSSDYYAIRSHPYIGNKEAQLIARFFNHNKAADLSELKLQPFLSPQLWHKIKPYIKICESD